MKGVANQRDLRTFQQKRQPRQDDGRSACFRIQGVPKLPKVKLLNSKSFFNRIDREARHLIFLQLLVNLPLRHVTGLFAQIGL